MHGTEVKNGIDFVITMKCNFRCPYCDQGTNKKDYISANDEVVDAFINYLKTASRKYNINIVGGEPTIHPRFTEVVEAIINNGHTFRVCTNFSMSLDFWQNIANYSKNNFTILQISYHPTQIKDKEAFCNKIIEFSKMKNHETKLFVSIVLNEENYEDIMFFKSFTDGHGIELQLQHERDDNGNFVKYPEKLENLLKANGHIDGLDFLKNNNLRGVICTSGINFFSVGPNGDILRCYGDANRFNSLGNIKDFSGEYIFPVPCLSNKCTCTLPYQYGCIQKGKNNIILAGALTYASKHRKLSNLVRKFIIKKRT